MLPRGMKVWNILLLITLLLVAGCGNDSSDSSSAVYNVEYIENGSPVQGKTTFQLRITKRSDGSVATGLHPELQLMMSAMGHATPVDSVTESGTPGYYDCTVYYLMSGDWEMQVTVEGETTTFNPTVTASMGVSASLYGADDIVTDMSGTSYNKYYIFRDGPISAASGTLNLYISRGENMRMDFKPLAAGTILSVATGTISVTSMLVTASTDTNFVNNVTTANSSNNGHFSLTGLSDLVAGVTSTIYVKLNVNGQDKTKDGIGAGANAYATFTVMPE